MALTAEEQAELQALESQVGGKSGGLTPEEHAEMQSLEAELGGQNAQKPTNSIDLGPQKDDSVRIPLPHGGHIPVSRAKFDKAMDFMSAINPGSYIRSGISAYQKGKVGEALNPVLRLFNAKDEMGQKVQTPSTRDLQPTQFNEDHPILSKATSFAGDFASDMAGGALLNKGGRMLFNSAFAKPDVAVSMMKGNKKLPSSVMWQEGIDSPQEAFNVANQAKSERDAAYNALNEKGTTVDIEKALEPAQSKIDLWKQDRSRKVREMADKAQEELNIMKEDYGPTNASYGPNRTAADVPTLSDLKTGTYNELPGSFFETYKTTTPAQELKGAMGSGMRQEILRSAEESVPGMGSHIDSLNEKIGSILSAAPQFKSLIKSAATNKAGMSQVDAMAMALSPKAYLFKQAARAAGVPANRAAIGRTVFGLGEMSKVTNPLIDLYNQR